MDKYIIELLDTNTRVIIPDFGAFIIKQKDPRLIVFNEFLRYNDGLLIEFVAKSENIDKVLAKKKVVEYVDLANKNLKDDSEHTIEGLGKLIKETTGKITFEEIPGIQAKESKKKESKKTTQIKEDKKAKADEALPEKPVVSKTEKEPPKIKEEKPVEKKVAETPAKEESKKEIIAKPSEETAVKPKAESPVKPKTEPVAKEKEDSILRPKAEHKPEPPYKTADIKRKKKNNAQIVIWIILILVINAAIISWFVFKDEYRGFFKRLSGTTDVLEEETADQGPEITVETEDMSAGTEAGIEEPAAGIQSQKIAEPEVAPEIEEEPVSYSEKRYYIVAGCFREESNATAYVKKLIQKGYDAEKFAKIGNLHYVSYSSFIDKSEAQSQLRKIRDKEAPEAWMLYH